MAAQAQVDDNWLLRATVSLQPPLGDLGQQRGELVRHAQERERQLVSGQLLPPEQQPCIHQHQRLTTPKKRKQRKKERKEERKHKIKEGWTEDEEENEEEESWKR
jgi:hypothetical protein